VPGKELGGGRITAAAPYLKCAQVSKELKLGSSYTKRPKKGLLPRLPISDIPEARRDGSGGEMGWGAEENLGGGGWGERGKEGKRGRGEGGRGGLLRG
jgi:hypothetical protein